jgi:hypothetical protein
MNDKLSPARQVELPMGLQSAFSQTLFPFLTPNSPVLPYFCKLAFSVNIIPARLCFTDVSRGWQAGHKPRI